LSLARRLPELEPGSDWFWTSGADGVLRIQHCPHCDRYQQPPMPRCTVCGNEQVGPRTVSGRGQVVSFTVNHEKWLPELPVPFVFAVVELEEQAELYLFTNIAGPIDAVQVGMAVHVTFEQHEDVWLPMFEATHG
jgi:uncharacterized protein